MIAVFPCFNMYVGGPFIVDQKISWTNALQAWYSKDKGMIQLPFRIRIITAPLGQTLDQDHPHPLKKNGADHGCTATFLPFFTRRVVWVTMGWCSLRTILSIRGHSSQKSRSASSQLIPIFPDSDSRDAKNPMKTQPGAEWRDELYVVWWIH